MFQTPRRVSFPGADYSNLFHSGLRMPPHFGNIPSSSVTNSTQPSLSFRSLREKFWSHFRRSTDSQFEDAASQWADVSSASEVNPSSNRVSGEPTPEGGHVWIIKGIPLSLEQSCYLSHDESVLSPTKLISLDPLAPSPTPTPSPHFDSPNAGVMADPFSQNESDESFLSLASAAESTHPYAAISIQAMTLPSEYTPTKMVADDSWLYGWDLESPSEPIQSRLDEALHSLVEEDAYRVDDDWWQFHTDWIKDDQQMAFDSPILPS